MSYVKVNYNFKFKYYNAKQRIESWGEQGTLTNYQGEKNIPNDILSPLLNIKVKKYS